MSEEKESFWFNILPKVAAMVLVCMISMVAIFFASIAIVAKTIEMLNITVPTIFLLIIWFGLEFLAIYISFFKTTFKFGNLIGLKMSIDLPDFKQSLKN